jgi:DNA-binding NtrC family response regulator
MAYDWPGNVRELHNAVESAMAVGTGAMLRAEDLPAEVRGETLTVIGDSPSQLNLDRSLRDLERQVIGNALRHAGSQRSRAAKLMGISRSRLYRRMDALNIDPNQVH